MANSAYRFSLASDSVTGMAKILQTLESKEHALKAGELAKLLGVTRQHIYKMAAANAIPSFRVGTAVRFDPKQVEEWLTRRMPQTVAAASLAALAVDHLPTAFTLHVFNQILRRAIFLCSITGFQARQQRVPEF